MRCVYNFLDEFTLLKSWDTFEIDFTHCYEVEDAVHLSTLDHFFWNEEFSEQVIDSGAIHSPDNSSDHSPIYCVVNVQPNQVAGSTRPPGIRKPCWNRASQDDKNNFKVSLNEKLSNVSIPESVSSCRNVNCRDTNHQNDVDTYMAEVLSCVEEEAFTSLPVSKPNSSEKKLPKPGWSDQVKPFRDTAHFWCQVWKSAGKPVNTVLHGIMKRSRNIYHYQYRKCERSQETIKKNKVLDACINGEGDIFKEIKSFRNSAQTVSTSMDGVQQNIQEHFKDIYSKLYNSHNDADAIIDIEREVKSRVNQSHVKDVEKVTPDLVKEAVKHLKNNKSDPTYSFHQTVSRMAQTLFTNIFHQLCSPF